MSQISLTFGQDLDEIISAWSYNPAYAPGVRLVRASDGRIVLQIRIELGVMQLEAKYRPDGATPFGFKTYFSYLRHLAAQEERKGGDFVLDSNQLIEAIRELKQFSLRRTCWLTLGKYSGVVLDAKHCLELFQFIFEHSTSENLNTVPSKYKTLDTQDSWFGFSILELAVNVFHETLATAMCVLKKQGISSAIENLTQGIDRFHQWKEHRDCCNGDFGDDSAIYEEQFSFFVNQWIENLLNVKRNLQSQCGIIPSLTEQMLEAIRLENYEKAAEIRNRINQTHGEKNESEKPTASQLKTVVHR